MNWSSSVTFLINKKKGRHDKHRIVNQSFGPNDKKWIQLHSKKRNPRFYDMDYSYERMQMGDRLLDMKPAPPPYSDTRIYYDLDTLPQVPTTNTAYDAYIDVDVDDDKPDDDDDGDENTDTMTKENWESTWKREDGTYNINDLYFGASETTFAKLEPQVYDWFKNYTSFELDYTFPNIWFNEETRFKVNRVTDENGVENIQFQFYAPKEYGGGIIWYSIPYGKNVMDTSTTDPEPGPDTEDPKDPSNDITREEWESEFKKISNGVYYYTVPPGLFTNNSFYTSQQVLSDEQWQWLENYIKFEQPADFSPGRSTPIHYTVTGGSIIAFSYGDKETGFKSTSFNIKDPYRQTPLPSDQQDFNRDKELWTAEYVDPMTNNFIVPANALPLGIRQTSLTKEGYQFLSSVFKYYPEIVATNGQPSIDEHAQVYIYGSYVNGVKTYTIQYTNPGSKTSSEIIIKSV